MKVELVNETEGCPGCSACDIYVEHREFFYNVGAHGMSYVYVRCRKYDVCKHVEEDGEER